MYVLPAPAVEIFDRERQRLDLVAFVNEVTVTQNLAVIKTPPGHANGVGRAIDLLSFPGFLNEIPILWLVLGFVLILGSLYYAARRHQIPEPNIPESARVEVV